MKYLRYAPLLMFLLPTITFAQLDRDPALAAFAKVANDDFSARSLLDEPRRELEADEINCGDAGYGEVLACKANAPEKVVGVATILSMVDMHRYWLKRLSDDFIEMRRTAFHECKDSCADEAKFIADDERSQHQEGSVFSRLIAVYCREAPNSSYEELDGSIRRCGK